MRTQDDAPLRLATQYVPSPTCILPPKGGGIDVWPLMDRPVEGLNLSPSLQGG
jgi:hypothetical protein